MIVSHLNPTNGVYPEDIRDANGSFAVEKARVEPPLVERASLPDLEREANNGWSLCKSLLKSTIFPSHFHQSMVGRSILRTFATVDINFEQNAIKKETLKRLGATIENVETADHQQIELMRLTEARFRQAIRDRGGWFTTHHVNLYDNDSSLYHVTDAPTHSLLTISTTNPDLKADLLDIGWKEVTINGDSWIQFSIKCGVTDFREKETPEVIIRFHPNVHYYITELEYLINHLALGKDVVFFDSRGLSPTELPPSEEGFYLDSNAIYLKVRDGFGYSPDKIYLGARCSGTTQAINLRKTYPNDPFHMVLEDPFERWSDLIRRQAWPLNQMGLSAMSAIRSTTPLTLTKASEAGFVSDLFDNIRKLQSITRPLTGSRVIIISTDTDQIIGTDAAPVVAAESARLMETYHLKYRGKDPKLDGHFEDVFLERPHGPAVFAAYSRLITNKEAEHLSNFR